MIYVIFCIFFGLHPECYLWKSYWNSKITPKILQIKSSILWLSTKIVYACSKALMNWLFVSKDENETQQQRHRWKIATVCQRNNSIILLCFFFSPQKNMCVKISIVQFLFLFFCQNNSIVNPSKWRDRMKFYVIRSITGNAIQWLSNSHFNMIRRYKKPVDRF